MLGIPLTWILVFFDMFGIPFAAPRILTSSASTALPRWRRSVPLGWRRRRKSLCQVSHTDLHIRKKIYSISLQTHSSKKTLNITWQGTCTRAGRGREGICYRYPKKTYTYEKRRFQFGSRRSLQRRKCVLGLEEEEKETFCCRSVKETNTNERRPKT